jgi:hypothetical protein
MRFFLKTEKPNLGIIFSLIFFYIFIPIRCFSLEVGDMISFTSKKLIDGHYDFNQDVSFYSVEAYDNVLDAYFLRIETLNFDQSELKNTEFKWVLAKDFPTGKQINDLLKNCEAPEVGGKKVVIKIIVGSQSPRDDGLRDYDVCKTSKQFFPANPFGPSTYYFYGQFEIFGLVAAKMEEAQATFFSMMMANPDFLDY